MRTLFGLFALANLILFLLLGRETPSASPVQAVETHPRLVLLSELVPGDRPGPRVALSPESVPPEISIASGDAAPAPDIGAQIQPEATPETTTTSGAKSEAGLETKSEAGLEAKPGAGLEAKSEEGLEAKSEAGLEARPGAGLEARPGARLEAKPEVRLETQPKTEPKPSNERCYRVEGIPDAKALAQAKSRLAGIGAHVSRTGETAFQQRRYWVFLPRFRSREEALPVMSRLRAAGIKDFYFVSTGENKNTLSLGMFSTGEGARRRVTQMAPLKLKVQTREVVSPGKRFYLEVNSAKSASELTRALSLPEPGNVRVQACSVSR